MKEFTLMYDLAPNQTEPNWEDDLTPIETMSNHYYLIQKKGVVFLVGEVILGTVQPGYLFVHDLNFASESTLNFISYLEEMIGKKILD